MQPVPSTTAAEDNAMKNICLFVLCLSPLLALAQEGPNAAQSPGAMGVLSGPDCVANCEATLAACKQQCLDTKARADVRHYDEGDVSVSDCISGCETDAKICKDDC
jgi:hypothetical protein